MTYNNCINYFSIIFMRIEYKIIHLITIEMKLRDYKELAYFEKNSSFFKKLKIIKRFQYQKKIIKIDIHMDYSAITFTLIFISEK